VNCKEGITSGGCGHGARVKRGGRVSKFNFRLEGGADFYGGGSPPMTKHQKNKKKKSKHEFSVGKRRVGVEGKRWRSNLKSVGLKYVN